MALGRSPDHGRIRRMYDAYNGRDLEALVAFTSEAVDWPDGDQRLHGRAAVSQYWSRRWACVHTRDEVIGIADLGSGRTAVRISQVVRDIDGAMLSSGTFEHVYEFRDGLVVRMNIREI